MYAMSFLIVHHGGNHSLANTPINGLSKHAAALALDRLTLIHASSTAGDIKGVRLLMEAIVIYEEDFISCILSIYIHSLNHDVDACVQWHSDLL